MRVGVCMHEREREKESVCACARETERERESSSERMSSESVVVKESLQLSAAAPGRRTFPKKNRNQTKL